MACFFNIRNLHAVQLIIAYYDDATKAIRIIKKFWLYCLSFFEISWFLSFQVDLTADLFFYVNEKYSLSIKDMNIMVMMMMMELLVVLVLCR